ncbi:hypothetical protein WR25_09980 [Diploscapter pachys]|uniref:Uncharacterized protein n=1 Tax=Diploscapter pachys TaxID=2018661 RepID=A0A2A2M5F6_9BILA|nr:hypothetical protein WR25_09980 [Diploscapter pachys]
MQPRNRLLNSHKKRGGKRATSRENQRKRTKRRPDANYVDHHADHVDHHANHVDHHTNHVDHHADHFDHNTND